MSGFPDPSPSGLGGVYPHAAPAPLVDDELDLIGQWLPLDGLRIIELGCGAARLARSLVRRHAGSRVSALEVDARQHAKNLADPQPGLHFVAGGAQSLPFAAGEFDLALMLKSLHHVPLPLLDQALDEVARVLRPGGHLYVSEPVYAGALNGLMRGFNDEGEVRAAAQAALDRALVRGGWRQLAERCFDMPVRFTGFAEFEQRMMRPTFADHGINDEILARVAQAYAPHAAADGSAMFTRPLHARLLQRTTDR